jgi:hypothetical protein
VLYLRQQCIVTTPMAITRKMEMAAGMKSTKVAEQNIPDCVSGLNMNEKDVKVERTCSDDDIEVIEEPQLTKHAKHYLGGGFKRQRYQLIVEVEYLSGCPQLRGKELDLAILVAKCELSKLERKESAGQ